MNRKNFVSHCSQYHSIVERGNMKTLYLKGILQTLHATMDEVL